MTGQPARIGLRIEPLDPLFFRRGRPFEAGSTAVSGLPLPQTLAGALRTMLLREAGCDFERLREAIAEGESFPAACDRQGGRVAGVGRAAFRGPWIASEGEPVVIAPPTLARDRETGELLRVDPMRPAPPGWEGMQQEMLPLWPRRDRKRRCGEFQRIQGAFLTLKGLQDFLAGGVPAEEEIVPSERLYDLDPRTGIAVASDTGTAAEGMIYGIGYLALRPAIAFYAELSAPEPWIAALFDSPVVLPFGGEGRRVQVAKCPVAAWPSVRQDRADGAVLVLTTPAPFAEGWRPPNVAPIAAAVSGHVALSGWDLARGGPKPTRFAVEAGSAYFVAMEDPIARETPDSLCEGEDERQGWGACVRGVWTYA